MLGTLFGAILLLSRGSRRARWLRILYRISWHLESRDSWTIRVRILRALGAMIGARVTIKAGVLVDQPEGLVIGDDVSIQPRCYLSAAGGISIASKVSIAHDCSIMSSSHDYQGSENIRKAPLTYKPVTIGGNVWIGMKSAILMGVDIGHDCVVGACSLVRESVEAGSVVAGIPVRRIGSTAGDAHAEDTMPGETP